MFSEVELKAVLSKRNPEGKLTEGGGVGGDLKERKRTKTKTKYLPTSGVSELKMRTTVPDFSCFSFL